MAVNKELVERLRDLVNAATEWKSTIFAPEASKEEEALSGAVEALEKVLSRIKPNEPSGEEDFLPWMRIPSGWWVKAPNGEWYEVTRTKQDPDSQAMQIVGLRVNGKEGIFKREAEARVTCRPGSKDAERDAAIEVLATYFPGSSVIEDWS